MTTPNLDTSTLPRCPTCGQLTPESLKIHMKAIAAKGGASRNKAKGFGNLEVKAKMIAANKARFAAQRALKPRQTEEEKAARLAAKLEARRKAREELEARRTKMKAIQAQARELFRQEKLRFSADYLNTTLANLREIEYDIGHLVERAHGEGATASDWAKEGDRMDLTLRQAIRLLANEIYDAAASKNG